MPPTEANEDTTCEDAPPPRVDAANEAPQELDKSADEKCALSPQPHSPTAPQPAAHSPQPTARSPRRCRRCCYCLHISSRQSEHEPIYQDNFQDKLRRAQALREQLERRLREHREYERKQVALAEADVQRAPREKCVHPAFVAGGDGDG